MYLLLKLQRESYEYWKKHYNSVDTPWTAEFMMGWRMTHRPWLYLLALLEVTIECGLFLLICVIYFR